MDLIDPSLQSLHRLQEHHPKLRRYAPRTSLPCTSSQRKLQRSSPLTTLPSPVSQQLLNRSRMASLSAKRLLMQSSLRAKEITEMIQSSKVTHLAAVLVFGFLPRAEP